METIKAWRCCGMVRRSILMAAGLLFATSALAQANRTNVNNNASKAKFAIYGKLSGQGIQVAGDTIFYVEKNDNNAVMAIDIRTGSKSVILPGVSGVYEGARPRIKKFWKVGDRKIFTRSDVEGVGLWDGKGVKSSPMFEGSVNLVSCAGDYALFEGRGTYDLWDVRNLRQIWRLSGEVTMYGDVLLMPNGTAWYYAVNRGDDPFNPRNDFGAVRIGLDGKSIFYCKSMMTQPYVVENGLNGKTDNETARLVRNGDYIYLPVFRRVYRLNTADDDAKWEEFAKIPATMDGKFDKICINDRGDLLVRKEGSSKREERTQLYRAGHFDRPVNLDDEVSTGITSPYGYNRIYVTINAWASDAANNFIFHSGSEIYVYNPDGVAGYTKALGRVVQ